MSQSPLPATSATLAAAQPGAAGEAGLVASGRRVLEIEGQALAAVGARDFRPQAIDDTLYATLKPLQTQTA